MHTRQHLYKRDVSILAAIALVLAIALLVIIILIQTGRYQVVSEVATTTPTTTPTYLTTEEVIIIEPKTSEEAPVVLPVTDTLFEYIEVIDGCGIHYGDSECLNVRSGPGTDYPVQTQLRNGIVLKVGGAVERDGQTWYKIVFDEWLRFPERLKGDWYVAADYVRILLDEGDKTIWEDGAATTTKRIEVSRSTQTLTAYQGDEVFMTTSISTGLEMTPTPRGTFTIFKKTPSRYMQGPLPGFPASDYYDLPGVPWNLYFTHQGAVIHGAYWHDSFGEPYSHGCVNLETRDAEKLYLWAELGTPVIVTD